MMDKGSMRKCLCLAAAAVVLASGPAVGRAMAYFTANAEAKGSVTLNMNFTEIEPDEEIVSKVKRISIQNTGDVECYVRVKIFAGQKYQNLLSYEGSSVKWNQNAEDGYFYYSDIVMPQGSTDDDPPLLVKLEMLESKALEDGLEDFNVIVIAECTPVLYHEDGSPYADWDANTGWNASVEQKPDTGEE